MNYITEIIERAERAGFKMSDICREANIDQAQLSRWTAGTTVPLVTSIDKLKHATERLIAKRQEYLQGLSND